MKKIGKITLYDLNEISEKLEVSVFTLRNYLKAGKLNGRKIGSKYFITEDNIEEFLNNRKTVDGMGKYYYQVEYAVDECVADLLRRHNRITIRDGKINANKVF
ncbi:MAG: helix-turn-helix domain-containing protein, partial [Candidatus Muiribacteriaceae bacterium]